MPGMQNRSIVNHLAAFSVLPTETVGPMQRESRVNRPVPRNVPRSLAEKFDAFFFRGDDTPAR